MAQVTFEGARYPLHEGENVLDALLRGGARVSFSCRKGSCQSCVLRVTRGEPDAASQARLDAEMRANGHFLPCLSRPERDISIERVDPSALFVRAAIVDKTALAPDVVRLQLEPEVNVTWRPGQYVHLRKPGQSESRCYSIASVQEEDDFMEIHVRRVRDGRWSPWLCDTVLPGEVIEIRGPMGSTTYDPSDKRAPLLLVAGGTGLAPLIGVVRDALRHGHRARSGGG